MTNDIGFKRYWPGGIPAYIRPHPVPLTNNVEISREVRGWQLFLEEEVPPANDPRYDSQDDELVNVALRRDLVSRWASMTQEGRDSYHMRASLAASTSPTRKPDWYPETLAGPARQGACSFCVALLPRRRQHLPGQDDCKEEEDEASAARGTDEWAIWTKFRIILYHMDESGETEGYVPLFDPGDIAVITPNPAISAANPDAVVSPADFSMAAYVENADLGGMAMTSQGTVIFHDMEPHMFIDEKAMQHGGVMICDRENNGQIIWEGRIPPTEAATSWTMYIGTGKPMSWNMDRSNKFKNTPVNMRQPILDVIEAMFQPLMQGYGDDESWIQQINETAPGYLEMEEAVTVMVDPDNETEEAIVRDYDHSLFSDNRPDE